MKRGGRRDCFIVDTSILFKWLPLASVFYNKQILLQLTKKQGSGQWKCPASYTNILHRYQVLPLRDFWESAKNNRALGYSLGLGPQVSPCISLYSGALKKDSLSCVMMGQDLAFEHCNLQSNLLNPL